MGQRTVKLGAGAVVVAVVAWLAFGYFGIQAAFLDDEVDEAGPIFDATPAEQDIAATEEFQDAMAASEATEVAEEMPEMGEEEAASTSPEIVTVVAGEFSGASRYEISGEMRFVQCAGGRVS
ncbi:MAG: hypothetical protein ACRBI6_22515 [Acidimicrobiales bacterium]